MEAESVSRKSSFLGNRRWRQRKLKKKRRKKRETGTSSSRAKMAWDLTVLSKTQNLGMTNVHAKTTRALIAFFCWIEEGGKKPKKPKTTHHKDPGRPAVLAWQLLLCSMTCRFHSGKLQLGEQHSSGWVWCQGGGFHPTYSCTKGWLWQQFLGYNFINSLFFPNFQCEFRPQHRFRLTSLFCVITF